MAPNRRAQRLNYPLSPIPHPLVYWLQPVDEEEQAYDITSSVFVKALQGLHKYEFRGLPFSSWLFRIAKSELYQSFRDQKAKRTVSIDKVVLKQVIEDWTEDYRQQDVDRLLSKLRLLKENNGYLPYNDKSEPEAIYLFFAMSKKTFKMTTGNLYRERKISFEGAGIKLL